MLKDYGRHYTQGRRKAECFFSQNYENQIIFFEKDYNQDSQRDKAKQKPLLLFKISTTTTKTRRMRLRCGPFVHKVIKNQSPGGVVTNDR